MAGEFTQGSGDYVDHGSSTALDDMAGAANGMTWAAWVYSTSTAANQFVISKGGSTGHNFYIDNNTGAGQIHVLIRRATTDTNYISSTGVVDQNTWNFIAGTYQDSLSTEVDIYKGTLSALCTETGYTTTTNGSGSHSSDASSPLLVGNYGASQAFAMGGRIGRVWLFDTRLTLEQLQRFPFDPFAYQSNCVLHSVYHPDAYSSQPDLSGNGETGTLNGTVTQADHYPRPIHKSSKFIPYVVAAQFELIANSGSYTVSGTSAGLDASRLLTANAGSYNLSGTNADLDASRLLTANSGAYTYTGTNADLDASRLLTANAGSYTLSGTDVDLEKLFVLNANAGSYTYTGTNADLDASRLLTANSGSYTYTGTSADLDRQYLLTSNSGTYTYTGTNSTLIKSSSLSASSGSYIISGTDVELTASGIIWTVQTDTTTTWSTQSDESTTWSQQSDENTTWTVQ